MRFPYQILSLQVPGTSRGGRNTVRVRRLGGPWQNGTFCPPQACYTRELSAAVVACEGASLSTLRHGRQCDLWVPSPRWGAMDSWCFLGRGETVFFKVWLLVSNWLLCLYSPCPVWNDFTRSVEFPTACIQSGPQPSAIYHVLLSPVSPRLDLHVDAGAIFGKQTPSWLFCTLQYHQLQNF